MESKPYKATLIYASPDRNASDYRDTLTQVFGCGYGEVGVVVMIEDPTSPPPSHNVRLAALCSEYELSHLNYVIHGGNVKPTITAALKISTQAILFLSDKDPLGNAIRLAVIKSGIEKRIL